MFAALTICGALLVGSAAVIWVADSNGQSARMPTQVPPRRVARYPLVAGTVLLVIGLAGSLYP